MGGSREMIIAAAEDAQTKFENAQKQVKDMDDIQQVQLPHLS